MAIIYGVYKLYSSNFGLFGFEIVLLFGGVLINLMTEGVQLDFTNKKFREYFAIAGLKHGKWIELQDLDYVTVFNQQVVKQGGVQSLSYRDKHKVFVVRIIADKEQFYDVSFFEKKDKAIEAAIWCAQKLNIKLLDYTDQKPEWVDVHNGKQTK